MGYYEAFQNFVNMLAGNKGKLNMSWSIWAEIDCGGSAPVSVTDSFNYTYNCNPMLHEAGIDLKELVGKPIDEVSIVLSVGVSKILRNPAIYRAMNPDNGWGDVEGLLAVLNRIILAFAEVPNARLAGSF